MPYSGANDKSLPSNVKKMPDKKRRQWVHVFNSMMQRHDGDESRAFAAANSVAGKKDSDAAFKGYLSGWDASARQLSQKAAGYDPFGAKGGKGCATCHWFVSPNTCVLVAGDISPMGMSDLYRAEEVYDPNAPENAMPVRLVAIDMTEKDVDAVPSIIERVVNAAKDWFTEPEDKPQTQDGIVKPFWTTKDANGRLRFFLLYSNGFKDKHGQYIPEAAHKEYADWVTQSAIYPELHLWHGGPGSRVGQIDSVDFVDGFALSSGLIDEGREDVVLKAQETEGGLGASHGFLGHKDGDTWFPYRDFEQTILPAKEAANVWTAFGVQSFKELDVPLSDKKKAWYKSVGLSDADVAAIETRLPEMANALKGLGIDWKSADEAETAAQQTQQPTQQPKPEQQPQVPTPQPAPSGGSSTQESGNANQGTQAPVPSSPSADAGKKEVTVGDLQVLVQSIQETNQAVASLATAVKQLQQTDDTKIAALIAPRNPGVLERPSQSNATAAVKDANGGGDPRSQQWFIEQVGEKILQVARDAPAGANQ